VPAHIHPIIVQFASNLVLRVHGSLSSSVSGCTWLIQNHRVPRVPLPGVGITPYQDDFKSHLRRHYSSFIAHTDSCARPNPSQRLGFPLYAGSLQLIASPCWEMALPDIISATFVQVLGSILRCVFRVLLPASSPETLASRHRKRVRHTKLSLQCDFHREPYFGAAIIRYLQAPVLVRPPGHTHRSNLLGGQAVYTTHSPDGYPFRDVALLRVQHG